MPFITTYTGKSFDPIDPDPKLIDIDDVAHALSLLCRANGHFPEFYSVGIHSLNCAEEARARGYSARMQLACLIHDASEAYLSDITRPVKSVLTQYKDIENRLQNIIDEKWLGSALSEEEYRLMREIDDAILYCEILHYFKYELYEEAPKICSEPIMRFESFSKTEDDLKKEFAHLSKIVREGNELEPKTP